jgi:hypothetical protein
MKRPSIIAKLLTGNWRGASVLLLVLLCGLFYGVFIPGYTLFSNDGPLSELVTQSHRLPERFTGCWQDLNSVGFNGGAAPLNISLGLQWLLGPVLFSKIYAIVSLFLLGISAWIFLRQSRLTPLACSLGALAAVLNSTLFSVAAWGISAHVLTIAMFFLALAAMMNTSSGLGWLRLILAGFAIGMGVTEGADVGAIFSLYFVAFVIYQAWVAEGPRVKNMTAGFGRLTIVVVCAVLLAAQAIFGLVTTVEGVAVTTQQSVRQTDMNNTAENNGDENNSTQSLNAQKRWDWATQWSLPKREILSLVVPSLFGNRMDTPNGGSYWGMMGRDANWQKFFDAGGQGPLPHGFARYTGGGNYIGVLVAVIAIWSALQSFSRKNPVFTPGQRHWLWFWLAVVLFSLLLALGHYAFFYRLVYSLPYFSTIRNPTKFLYPFDVGMIALFAFGIDGLQRRYMEAPKNRIIARWPGFDSWWKRATLFEKYWIYGCGLVWVVSIVGWYFYAQYHDQLVQYMQFTHVPGNLDAIATYSIHHVAWFVVTFFLAALLLVLIFSGVFIGRQAGGVLLALLLVIDLGLANQPWITFWNYHDKYASNAVLDLLRDKPYEHRVAMAPINVQSSPQLSVFGQYYRVGWLQQQFPYYNIQAYDVIEMPRIPEDYLAFRQAFTPTNGANFHTVSRIWALENTKYILAPATFGTYWNSVDYLAKTPLRMVMRYDIALRPGFTAATSPDQLTAAPSDAGRFAVFEYDAALPRALLYSNWQVDTNGPEVLNHLVDPAFDPHSLVYVDNVVPAMAENGNPTNPPAGTVDITHYAPKDILLKADVTAPSVLFLDDHYHPNWNVFVDGRIQPLLRCDFLMRGVYLASGDHQVEFKFEPPVRLLYVSIGSLSVALLLLGAFIVLVNRNKASVAAASPVMTPLEAAQPQSPAAKVDPKRPSAPRPKSAAKSGKK